MHNLAFNAPETGTTRQDKKVQVETKRDKARWPGMLDKKKRGNAKKKRNHVIKNQRICTDVGLRKTVNASRVKLDNRRDALLHLPTPYLGKTRKRNTSKRGYPPSTRNTGLLHPKTLPRQAIALLATAPGREERRARA